MTAPALSLPSGHPQLPWTCLSCALSPAAPPSAFLGLFPSVRRECLRAQSHRGSALCSLPAHSRVQLPICLVLLPPDLRILTETQREQGALPVLPLTLPEPRAVVSFSVQDGWTRHLRFCLPSRLPGPSAADALGHRSRDLAVPQAQLSTAASGAAVSDAFRGRAPGPHVLELVLPAPGERRCVVDNPLNCFMGAAQTPLP